MRLKGSHPRRGDALRFCQPGAGGDPPQDPEQPAEGAQPAGQHDPVFQLSEVLTGFHRHHAGRTVCGAGQGEYCSEVKGLVHDTSSSGATVFIEPMSVVEANNEIKVLESQEKKEIDRILYELSASVGSYAEAISRSYEVLVELDLYFCQEPFGR